MSGPLDIVAVGDLSFHGRRSDLPSGDIWRDLPDACLRADLSIANLEGPLVESSRGRAVLGKCTLRGSPGWAPVMRQAGINVVTVANNHLMDFGVEGLLSTLEALDGAGIAHVGAGRNEAEARAPRCLKVRGTEVALVARTCVHVSSPSLAGPQTAGVAGFDAEETLRTVRECGARGARVVVLIHWGLEEYRYPSPEQRSLARALAEAGADVVLGHHPHVLQGFERIGRTVVAYSLGNFAFDEFDWTFEAADGTRRAFSSPLSERNREGMILRGRLDHGASEVRTAFTRIDEDARVVPDARESRGRQFARLCERLRWPLYDTGWRSYALRREWTLRVRQSLGSEPLVRRLAKVRLRHVRQLIMTLTRSGRIVAGRSTNPYD